MLNTVPNERVGKSYSRLPSLFGAMDQSRVSDPGVILNDLGEDIAQHDVQTEGFEFVLSTCWQRPFAAAIDRHLSKHQMLSRLRLKRAQDCSFP